MSAEALNVAEANASAWIRHKSAAPGHLTFEEPFAYWSIPQRPAGTLQTIDGRFADDPALFDQQIEAILRCCQEHDSPMNWFFGPTVSPQDIGKRLRRRGLMGPRYLPAMVADLSRPIAEPVWPVEEVTDWSEFETAPHPLVNWSTKASRPDVLPMLRSAIERAPGQAMALVACIDGVAVACATAYLHEAGIGVYDVVTLPEFQRRGAGASVVRSCLAWGRAQGARFATLQAYPKATQLYEREGFETVGRFTSLYYSRERMRKDRAARD